MDINGKREYLKAIRERYKNATKKQKRKILDEFCAVYEYNRKYAIRLINGIGKKLRQYLFLLSFCEYCRKKMFYLAVRFFNNCFCIFFSTLRSFSLSSYRTGCASHNCSFTNTYNLT